MDLVHYAAYQTYGQITAQMVRNDRLRPAAGAGSGAEIMFTTFTPTKPFVRIDAKIRGSGGGNDQGVAASIVCDGVVKDAARSLPTDTFFAMTPLVPDHVEAVATGTAITISARVGPRASGQSLCLNGYSGSDVFGGKAKSTLDIPMLDSVNF